MKTKTSTNTSNDTDTDTDTPDSIHDNEDVNVKKIEIVEGDEDIIVDGNTSSNNKNDDNGNDTNFNSLETTMDEIKKEKTKTSTTRIDRPRTSTRTRPRSRRKKNKNIVKFFAGNSCKYPVVREAATKLGWKIIEQPSSTSSEKVKNSCNIIWVDTSNVNDYFSSIQPWQRINHFPGMTNIARKTRLAEHLDCMKKRFPKDYAFYPTTYILPRDRHNMKKFFEPAGKSKTTYIVKPDGGCQGRGIFLTKKWDAIEELSSTHVAQRYISDPLLIDSKKFDLRIYVLITSCDPLRIYLFQDGLVRLCTQDFSKPTASNLDNTCMHLSNYSINKRSDDFLAGSEDDATGSSGSKRSVKWFLSWLADERGDDVAEKMWCKIGHICVKTIICIEPILVREYKSTFCLNNPQREEESTAVDRTGEGGSSTNISTSDEIATTCTNVNSENLVEALQEGKGKRDKGEEKNVDGSRSIAILGFDIMIDSKLKPHLIEVNHLPSFATDSPLDESIKSRVVFQALSAIQAAASDQQSYETSAKKTRQKRLFKGGVGTDTNTRRNMNINVNHNSNTSTTDAFIHSTTQFAKNKKTWSKPNSIVEVEEFITEIYSIHAPEKIDKVDVLLQKYKGNEEWLVGKLREKYCAVDGLEVKNSGKENESDSKQNEEQCEGVEFVPVDKCSTPDCEEHPEKMDLGGEVSNSLDQNLVYEDEILVENGDYQRIYPPKKGTYKPPAYEKMRKHAAEEDFKRQMRLVCPLWQLRKYERNDENVSKGVDAKEEVPPRNAVKNHESYCSRGDWLVHGNVHRKSEPIPTKTIPLPSQKQLEAAERLSRGFSVENSVLITEDEATKIDGNDFVTRLSIAEQAGKEIRKRNEEKFIPRSQLNMNPINIAFGDIPSSSRVPPCPTGERCYVDFTGRKLGYR